MNQISSLIDRIDAEFAASEKKIAEFQTRQVQAYEGRQQRLEMFQKACEQSREIWFPRLKALAEKFGDKVQVKPTVSRSSREVEFAFRSPLADIVLRFSASTDIEVRNLVLDYDLHILPILMKFEPHSSVKVPLDAIDNTVIAKWFDDRIVDFVRTYLSLHENKYYLKDHMVADPISGTQFPKYAAAETLEWKGTKYYFIGEETRNEFAQKNGIAT